MSNRPKTKSIVTPERVQFHLRCRFNPIRALTPELLARQLDSFKAGYLTDFALTAEAIEERDDIIKAVAPKRKKAVARHGYEVLTLDDSPEAQQHKEALEYFYNHLTCTSAIDQNERGSFKLLARQMMDAVGKKYAVHEIVWQPSAAGLTAEFRFTPLWFFENTLGRLRYLTGEASTVGAELAEGGWLTTVGEGLMMACAVAYMFKTLPLKDWLLYCERHGMPGIKGTTNAPRGSEEWNAMVQAVEDFGADFSAVMNESEQIELIDLRGQGELPYPAMIERMDRALAALWRGADLSTLSQSSGTGASLQGGEAELLEQDDAELISETLNLQVDRWVIRYLFGAEASPRAYVKILTSGTQNVDQDLKIDEFLLSHGAKLPRAGTMERYGRAPAKEGEEVLSGGDVNKSSNSVTGNQ